jgi:hypothetical protein
MDDLGTDRPQPHFHPFMGPFQIATCFEHVEVEIGAELTVGDRKHSAVELRRDPSLAAMA